jgi:signal transduction histidine kinase
MDGDRQLQADARRLGQVFHNIILNAIQAMPTGGTLRITSENGALCFADTGPGFSPEALHRWAEMLYSEKEGGMGIGLSVAKEIIRAHNGRLKVANLPEGGAIVRIEL